MIRNLRRLTAVLSVFAYSLLSAQGTCEYTDVSSGTDNSNYVEFNSFDCVDTVDNSYITEAIVDFYHNGSSWTCTNYYSFNLEVNGEEVASDFCDLDSVDLSTYGVDVNNITSIKIVSQDNDSWADNNTINAFLGLYYSTPTCPPPSGAEATNINPTTADISWDSNGSEALWNVEVVNITAGDTATGVATYSGVSSNSLYQITTLLPETEYEVYIQADCGPFNATPQSDWSWPVTFTTPPTCIPLGDISIDSVFDTSVFLSWAQIASETSWDIELINTSLTPPDTFTFTPTNPGLSTNAPELTGLVPESNYQVIVRANCGIIDGPSAWTQVYFFTTLPTCQAPIDLVLGSYDNDEITFSWTSIDTETMWYVEYVNVTLGEIQTGIADDSTFTESYTAINLDANSEYELYVSAACGGADGSSYWSGPVTITTLCNPVAMPFTEPFSTWVPDCFDVDNGDGDWNAYVTGGDTVAAQARNTWGNYSTNRHLIAPMVSISQEALLTFSWSHMENTNFDDTLSVRLSSDGGFSWTNVWSVTGGAFHSNDGASFSSPGSYIEQSLLIDNSYVGSDVTVDIAYTSPASGGNMVFIDSMAVTALPPCNIPYYLDVDSLYTTSVDMAFTVAGTGATSYEIEVIEGQDTITGVATDIVSGSPFTLTGLTPGTDYTVYARTICGSDSTVWVGPITFTTVCAPVAEYSTSFEGLETDDPINCWNLIDSSTSAWTNVHVFSATWAPGNTGIVSLHFDNYNVTSNLHQYAVLPEFSNVSDQTHRLRFYARQNNNGTNELVVGTITDPTDINTFTPKDTIDPTGTYAQYTFNFDDYTGSDSYVALRSVATSSWSDTYVDDVEWQEIPNCFPPTSVTIDSTSTTTVSVSIDSLGTFGTEWFIEMVDVTGTNPTVLDTAFTPSHTIDGLMSSTVYEMTISTNCPDAISEETTSTVATDCAPVGDFYNDFESLSGPGDTSVCWDYVAVHTSTSAWSFPLVDTYSSTWNNCDGTNAVRMYSGDELSSELLLITPELADINAGTHVLTFTATTFGSSWTQPAPFEVGTITDANDPSTFTSMYSGVAHFNCDSITVPYLSYTGTDSRIAIRFAASTTFDNLYIDKMKWEEGPACALPVGLIAEEILDSEVTLEWLNISPDTVWYLELVDVLDTLDVYDSIPTDTAFTHPFTITGLTENTIYDVYLSNLCDTPYADVQLTFVTPWGNNIGVTEILSPGLTGCNLSDSSQIEIEIENFGGLPATGFPVELSWDDSIFFNVGTFMDTIQPGATATFVVDGYYDFSTANDSSFWVQTALAGDSVLLNDKRGSSVTNLGNMLIDVQINTGDYPTEVAWALVDTVNGIYADSISNGTYTIWNSSYFHEVCVYEGADYVMNAWDTYDDGWNGGTYSITRCGGIILANNDGNEVDNGIQGIPWPNWDLEATESLHIEPCPDNDLAVMSIDGLVSACGLGIETGNVTIMNFGNNDVAANGATAQYMFNNSGLWIDFWNFDSGLASQEDTIMDLPAVDMSITGEYTIAVQVVFALDSDTSTNMQSIDITSVPTLTEDSTTFNSDNGGWTSEINTGVANSWEYGIPTTTVAGNGNDQEVWATNLTGNMALNESSYLNSPCYDFSSYTDDVELEFDFVKTSFSHSVQLQKSSNGGATWQWVFTATSNTNSWTHRTMLVSGLDGESDVRFRWVTNSSWSNPIEGFAFDNWEAYEHVPYTDASLSNLAVAGNTVSAPVAFDPAVLDYTYEVPYGSTNYNVSASVNAPFITSMTIDQVSSLPDTAFVTVVAEDNNYSSTYSVYITEGPAATDATLQSLSVSGNSVPNFHPDTLCYTLTYPYGSAFTPSVTYLENDPNATVQVNNVAIPGTATVVVTAEDGVTVNVYCINYEVLSQSSNALLSDLTADFVTVPGFTSGDTLYFMELPNGTTTPPTVIGTSDDPNATIAYTQAVNLPDTAVVEVTAEDGTIITYYVVFTEAAGTDASLLDLTINGGTVIGFDATTFNYFVELDYGTPIPSVNVGALAVDTSATVVVVDATGVPGTTVITVTAEDGLTVLIYYINWSYTEPSADATLFSMSSDLGGFCVGDLTDMQDSLVVDGSVLNYVLQVGPGSTSLADLLVYPNDDNVTITIEGDGTEAPYGEIIITVVAQDGFTTLVYTVDVTVNCTIGLDETVLGQISVSPNPSNGIFSIETPADLTNY
ncbi:fibronectin type III domain-containing protein, partial [Nonlabens dokdonensis]|uniref:choice-of-anchor J domain-containing protein n=1 Tax=Nonlabens dokdonensis TaxID=328515 RepID=UPI0026EB5B2E